MVAGGAISQKRHLLSQYGCAALSWIKTYRFRYGPAVRYLSLADDLKES